MNCPEFKHDIFLYAELNSEEKTVVDRHLEECAACRELFQAVQGVQTLVKRVAAVQPEPRHAAGLTRKIMDRVRVESQAGLVTDVLRAWVSGAPLRSALAVVSLVLVMAFGAELLSDTKRLEGRAEMQGSVINAALLKKSFVKRQERRPAYANCLSPVRGSANWKECIKSNLN